MAIKNYIDTNLVEQALMEISEQRAELKRKSTVLRVRSWRLKKLIASVKDVNKS